MMKKVKSDFLFAQPSFLSGAGSAFDLWGQLSDYNVSTNGTEADANAIAADWLVVGQDIFDALNASEGEHVHP
jgi:hypothetical protein